MKYVSSILVLFLLILAIGCAAPHPQVTRVIDGDTIEVDIAGAIYEEDNFFRGT